MPRLIVTVRELPYGGKTLLRGEQFDATDKHAQALKLIGKAADAPEARPVRKAATPPPAADQVVPPAGDSPPAASAAAQTTAQQADPAPSERELPPSSLGRYRHRRLTSED